MSEGKTQYKKWVERGRCGSCGKDMPDDAEYKQCKKCRQRSAKYMRERTKELLDNGQCLRCGRKLPDDYNKTVCQQCVTKKHIEKMEEYIPHMPDYMIEQLFKGLEETSELDTDEVE